MTHVVSEHCIKCKYTDCVNVCPVDCFVYGANRLVINPDNTASRRVAEKCGFRHEGTARGAWYNNGRHHNVEIYAILHDEVINPT